MTERRLSDEQLVAIARSYATDPGSDVITIRQLIDDLRAERAESAQWEEKYLAERDEGVRVVAATVLQAAEKIEAERAVTARLRDRLRELGHDPDE